MFLTGNHTLSYDLIVSDVHNITLRPYIEKTSVVSDSEDIVLFELSSDIVIRDMTFQTLGIQFDNSTNVTLSGLTADNAPIALNNVFGEVNISFFKSNFHYCCDSARAALVMMWTVTQPQHVPITVVLLYELDLGQIADGYTGVIILGCIPGKIILLNSTVNAGISMYLGPSCNEMLFICENTHFYNGFIGLYIGVRETPPHQDQHIMAVVLHNVSFIGYANAVVLENVQNVTISNSYFGSSSGGAVTASNCVLTLKGNVTFRDNYSTFDGIGGAISGDSQILIPEPQLQNTYILFENNTSNYTGGAIYFTDSYTGSFTTGYCKIFVEQYSSKIVFNFSMNTAANGGNAIYGAYLDRPCYSPNGTLIQNISQLILNVSYFTPSFSDDLSVISSDFETLCFCDENEINCDGPSHPNLPSVYPGQVFRLLVAARGDMNGLVRWAVYASVDQGKFGNEIQQYQTTNAKRCTYFQYSVLSTENSAILSFISSGLPLNSYTVNLLNCPLGFSLSNDSGCECQEYLLQNVENLACNITEQSIRRQGTTWIGVVENSTGSITLENTTALAFSNVCPFHYCNKSTVKIHVNQTSFLNEDIQCTASRSGVLCGGCRDSFSLALGSNRCLHNCSNNSLSLLIAFVSAGIALVFFIKILNLTVSQGTINGLIFYANIVGVEQTVLFSSRAYEGFSSVFIAWVNLDLGFETCFFDGMDAYTKSWLQFVFPVYVWAIALFIIILSHYSIRASKLFGNNSVPVLATLILLSYSKLLRAVISALSITRIQFLTGSTMSVWERNGNIQYLTGKHIPLFVFAVAVLVLIWFPFTLILTSIQWLQRGTHYRVLRWVTKLRPFFEAFTGPLKDKHRYWVGTLLLARCSLLLVFNVYTANGNGVAFISIILATLIILVFLAATGFVYRNYFLTVLELSYILNLGILATGILYVQYINDKGNQEALVMTCVGIAFLQFIATVIYHAYVQLREPLTKLKTKIVGIGSQEDADITTDYGSFNVAAHVEQPIQQPLYQEISDYREPLLAYLSD